MANIDRIARVQIGLRTSGVRQATFSDLMLIGVHTGPNRVEIITSADELIGNPSFVGVTTSHDLYKAAMVGFSQIPGPAQLYIGRRGASESLADALPAIASANNTWYAFTDVSHAEADLSAAAIWAEANQKLFLTAIANPAVAATSGTEPASALKASQYFRTAWWYNADPDQFPEVAIACKAFTQYPGAETWANQRLSSVTAPPLSEGAYQNITMKNGNTFEPFRNISITQNGVTAAGEYIDVIRFRDWLCEEIRTEVFNSLIDARIPYTDSGIAVIRQQIIKALDLGVRRGGIAPRAKDPDQDRVIPSYTVTVPSASQVSFADKQARILRDVSFSARLAGAIHAVTITGTLTYSDIG